MVNMKRGTWLAIALTLLMVSLVSMLLPVLTYELNGREIASFNVLDVAGQSLELTAILSTYTGELSLDIDPWVATLLAVLAGASVVAVFDGHDRTGGYIDPFRGNLCNPDPVSPVFPRHLPLRGLPDRHADRHVHLRVYGDPPIQT